MNLQQEKKKYARISEKRIQSGNYPKELTIVAEGDSWFDYALKKDIIDYLRKKGYAIKNFAKGGDTLDNMIYGTDYTYDRKTKKAKHLGAISLQTTLKSISELKPKFVLFSAGGNDIVGPEVAGYLYHKRSKPDNLINTVVFVNRLKSMEKSIRFFIESVHKKNKKAHILMDGYDYARVNGKGYRFIGVKLAGPWLLPSFAEKAIVTQRDQKIIVAYLVDKFNEMLMRLDSDYEYFHHINLRGDFPNDNQWHNEIHLKNLGFKAVAEKYHQKMCEIIDFNPIHEFKAALSV